MTGTRSRKWAALKVLPLVLFMGNKPNCDGTPPTLTCEPVSITLDRGTCVEIQNPCGDHQWVRLDAFRLCDAPDGIFIQTERDPRARFLCADIGVGPLNGEGVDFSYARPSDSGIGTFHITIGATQPLEVTASATPSSIPYGGSSQLDTTVSGGTPPYTYSWSPASGLSATDVSNPVAMPTVTTQYTVVVRDSEAMQQGATVIVNVGLGVTATANPASIEPGQASNLTANVTGGTPPYSYSWTPSDTLSSPSVGSPVASPTQTTTYTLTVTDFAGASAVASVTVTVTPPGLSACMTLIPLSPFAVRADGSCSTGSIVEYRWWSNFRPGHPPTATTTTPMSPVFMYEIRGSYTVRLEVLDSTGATDATTLVFTSP